MDGEPEDLNIRNDYMWFLLLVLQNKKVAAPFDSLPPGIIKPLREILVNLENCTLAFILGLLSYFLIDE